MKLHHLHYLVAVAEHGGVRSAATHLGVSSTAVSRALIELENEVGVPLLDRRADGIALTRGGQELLVHARLIARQMDAAGQTLAQLRGTTGARVAVGVTPWIAHSLLGAAIRDFVAERPDVQLDISEVMGTGYRALRDGTLDLAIGLAPQDEEAADFQVRPLFSYGQAVICRPGHPRMRARRLSELSDQAWLLSRELEQRTGLAALADAQPAGMPALKVHYARAATAALPIVRTTDMLGVCPWPLLETEGVRGSVHALNLQEELPETTTALLMRRNATASGAVHAFVGCFLRSVGRAQQSDDPALRRLFRTVSSA